MWDILILTAGNEWQKSDFELQLWSLDLSEYCSRVEVVADKGSVRIGAGGAMISLLHDLRVRYQEKLDEMKVLLIHSGGLSQRMPHLSCFGKVFAYLPGGTSVLELKMKLYSSLLPSLRPGLLVAASDVVEDVSRFTGFKNTTDFLLFANESDPVTASGHGVFVMNNGRLRCVLQKPSIELQRDSGAVQDNGRVLTDCFYWMSWSLSDRLASLHTRPLSDEICCYGDFMRPLGFEPRLEYLEEGSSSMQGWRRALAETFSPAVVEICNLGADTFFHLGTPGEFISHIAPGSIFSRKFLANEESIIFSRLNNVQVGINTYMEYCRLNCGRIGSNCILSGIETTQSIDIPNNLVIFTICVHDGYVTIAINRDDDVKRREERVRWMGMETDEKNTSLWDAELFEIEETREKSLQTTMRQLTNGEIKGDGRTRTSIAKAIGFKNLGEIEGYRNQLRVLGGKFLVHHSLVKGARTGGGH